MIKQKFSDTKQVFRYNTLFYFSFGHMLQITYTMKPRAALRYTKIFGYYFNIIGSASKNVCQSNRHNGWISWCVWMHLSVLYHVKYTCTQRLKITMRERHTETMWYRHRDNKRHTELVGWLYLMSHLEMVAPFTVLYEGHEARFSHPLGIEPWAVAWQSITEPLHCQTPTLTYCVPCREAVCTIFMMVFGMTGLGGELTTYRARGGHINH